MHGISRWLPAVLSVLVAASGWFYMFYSRAAHKLALLERETLNRKRRRLRQLNGFMMMLLAASMAAGFYVYNPEQQPQAFMFAWLAALALLAIIVALALIDVRMTINLRSGKHGNDE